MRIVKAILSLIMAILCSITFISCGKDETPGAVQEPDAPLTGESNVLVVYFSWSSSHNTQTMANYIAEETDGELFRLVPETPYTTDYDAVLDIAREEQSNNARPALAENITAEQLAGYDVIFVGYPIWWYDAPMIIYTFLESHDFSGKTIVPFATSGGSGIAEEDDFREITGATVLDGLCIRNINDSSARDDIRKWLTELALA